MDSVVWILEAKERGCVLVLKKSGCLFIPREFPWGFRESQYRLLTTSLPCGVPGYALTGSTTTASLLREVWGSPCLEKDWGSLLREGQDHVHQRLVVQVSEFLSEGVPQSV